MEIKKIIRNILVNVYRHCKVQKNRIVFSNFFGRGFGDNPKYIALEIQRQHLPFDLYWIVNPGEEKSLPTGIKPVRVHSLKSFYIFSTSRVIIYNAKGPLPYKKRANQYYIQTWHGSLIMKYVEAEVMDKISPSYAKDSQHDSEITDVFLTASDDDSNVVKKSFWYNHEIMKSGSPRSDIFFHTTKEQILKIRKNLDIDDNYKILLYAPTFRDDKSTKGYGVDIDKVLKALEKNTGESWIALIRMHPAAVKFANNFHYGKNVINVSTYPDPQDLSIICNAMLTDYSSIMLDAFLQMKPVFLFTCDYDDYIAKNRPMHEIYHQLPCKRNNNMKELVDTIKAFDKNHYLEGLKYFMDKIFVSYDDGHASERVVERIKKVINSDYQSPYVEK